MKLTPLDLQQKTFRKVRLGGLDEREVRLFLEQCASEMEELNRKLHKQDEELRRRESRITDYKEPSSCSSRRSPRPSGCRTR